MFDLVEDNEIIILKTHGDFNDRFREYESDGKIKIICTYRNPYDVILSIQEIIAKEQDGKTEKRFSGFLNLTSYDDVIARVARDVSICQDWLTGFDNAIHFPYYKSLQSIGDNIDRMSEFLGIEPENKNGIIHYFENKDNILEFNKGQKGRGLKIDIQKYPHIYIGKWKNSSKAF